ALLGGVDVDLITRKDVRSVRTYTRNIIEHCVVGGGFALGVGNWVWDALPIENYIAMLDEAHTFM
ncbi:MAG: uroporphyrinogen-III decarboxylase-like protein, partial [Planctomycetes bacterium]|nr:uroporphyrinogen-III decarboxylase-like protein [Planctomycetota bacterium]